jgi:hypothetical protein
LKHGFSIGYEGKMIKLMKGEITILFDRQITMENGFVPVIKMRPVLSDVGAATIETRKGNSKNKFNINNMHRILGHYAKTSAKLTGKALGYDVVGTFDTFEAFSIGKARQKNVIKDWTGDSVIAGEKLYVDICSIQRMSFGLQIFGLDC